MAFRLDRTELRPPVRRADGSVVYEGPVTRTGVFKYTQPDGSVRSEWRPPAEVGHKDSLESLQLVHVCDDHPPKRGEAKGKAVGAVGDDVRFDGKLVIAKVMVREDAVNAKVAMGKCQLSCGYDTVLVETPGVTPEGERYDAIQTQIRYEHVAIVAAGRAGPEVRLRLDALEPEDRDDAGVKLGGAGAASCSISSTSMSAVELEGAVRDAVQQMPGVYVDRFDSVRADAVTIEADSRWRAPSIWVSSRDLSLEDLTTKLAAALPGATVKRGDAADTTLRQDSTAMDLAAQLAAALKDAADQKTRADAAAERVKQLETERDQHKARADKAEGERDAAKDAAATAEQARKDAVDQGPALARARVKLEDKAIAVLGAEFKVDGKSDVELQRAVTEKLLGKALPADASPVYVAARFDAAIETIGQAQLHVDGARVAGRGAGDGPKMTEQQAMAEAKRRADARAKPAAGV